MKTKLINAAAHAHAKSELGDQQFRLNKDAVKCISDDFKAGAKWAILNIKEL